MIAKTNLSQLRVMEFFQVLSLIDAYLKSENLQELRLEEPHLKFKNALVALDESLQKVSTSNDTKKMRQADKLRSETLVGLKAIFKGFSRSPIEEQAVMGGRLFNQMQKYGKSIQKLALREKTAVITNLLQDFQKNEFAQMLSKLHLNSWVVALNERNAAFEQVYVERSKEQAEVSVGKVKQCRTDAQKSFDFLAKSINSLSFLYGGEPYKGLSDKIDNEINKALSEVKRRKSLSVKAKESKVEKTNDKVQG